MSALLEPLELSGRHVRLEPLTPAHSPELAAAVEDGRLYRLWYASVPEPQAMATEFRTHWLNQASRAAIARLGAKQDGVLRSHRRLADGSLRDTVVFSIIASEWPAVKRQLAFRLERGGIGER